MTNPVNSHKSLVLMLIFILPVCCVLRAQSAGQESGKEIVFSKSGLSVRQALDELNRLPDINIVYSAADAYLETKVQFTNRKLKVDQALHEIRSQAPVEFIHKNGHIVVKSRKLESSYNLSGKVIDAETSEPLIAADLYLQGTTKGTVTDLNGSFNMAVEPGSYVLVCQYVGFKDRQIPVNLYSSQELNIQLETRQHEIMEVNVTGSMGELEEIDKGRPIEKIEAKTVNQLNTNDVNDALHGRINGVWVTKVSGAPGDHNKVRIRGISSIFGSTDPLYVVDGVMIPVVNFNSLGIADLNTHDVESITILKDASSTALYGYQGGNGVVIVETKKGGGETRFDFSVKMGLQQFKGRYDLMNSKQFLTTLDSSDSKIRTKFYGNFPEVKTDFERYPYYHDTIGSDSFQDELFRTGKINEYQLSGKGNVRSIDYYLSGNYYNHEGVVVNSSYTKYTFTGNIAKTLKDKLSIRFQYRGAHQVNKNNLDNYLGNNVIFKGINYEPSYKFTPDSFLTKDERLYYNRTEHASVRTLSRHAYGPKLLFFEQEKSKTVNTHSLGMQLYYGISSSLSARVSLGTNLRNIHFYSFIPGYVNNYIYSGGVSDRSLSSIQDIRVLNHNYSLVYDNTFGKHNLMGSLTYKSYHDNVFWEIDSVLNVDINAIQPEDDIYVRGSSAIYGARGSVLRSINSGVFNLNYNYDEKYFISLLASYDYLQEGYYVDQKELFPSVALTWDLARENFLKLPDWVESVLLSANWGQSGNYPLNSLSNDLFDEAPLTTQNDTLLSGVQVANLSNHYIKHEKITETNFIAEANFFRNRLILMVDYYTKYNSDLLVQRDIPYYYGGGSFYQNIGEMKSTGLELSLEVTPVLRTNGFWTSRLGYSTNEQYITELYDNEPILFSNSDILIPDFHAKEGAELGDIIGYKYLGTTDEVTRNNQGENEIAYVEYYGLAYEKIDSLDSQRLTSEDKTVMGSSIPKLTLNWYNLIEIKNFTIEMLWYGALGVDKYNATKASTFISGVNSEVEPIVMDSLIYNSHRIVYESSFFVEDASFIRLKTLSFSYNQPRKIFGSVGIRYTLSFENLITFTRYSGYDPEATIYTNNNFSDNAIDKGSYPNPQGVYVSVNLSF